jgi:ATP-dependent DNA ligase
MFEHAAKLNWEGIVLKRADAPYRSERTEAWQKIKVVQKGKFPVIGFIKDPTGLAALYLGKKEGKDLVYMGKVGTGVVAHCLQPNTQATRYRRQSQIQALQTHQEAEGDVGGADIRRRYRVPRPHV